MRLGEAVVNIGPQGVQRDLSFFVLFSTGKFSAVETSCATDLDAFGTLLHRVLDGALHGPSEGHALHQLLDDAFRDELRVNVGVSDFLDLDEDFGCAGDRLQQVLDHINADSLLGVLAALLVGLIDNGSRVRWIQSLICVVMRS